MGLLIACYLGFLVILPVHIVVVAIRRHRRSRWERWTRERKLHDER